MANRRQRTKKTTIFQRFVLLVAIVGAMTIFNQYKIMSSNSDNFVVSSELSGQAMNDNDSKTVCKFPRLMIDDPLIKPHLKSYDPLKCTDEKNWVESIGDGRFYINEDAFRRHGKIECKYSRIDRITDWKNKEIDLGVLVNGTELDGDSFHVVCHSVDDNSTYDVLHMAVPNPNKEIRERIEKTKEKLAGRPLDLNVMIYLVDSVSRLSFIRHCPKFYELLTKEMGAYVMEGFNIVAEGTPGMVIPLTTGHFQTELPEARKRFSNASYLDDWPLIFKKYKADGYVTSFIEESPNNGPYNFLVKGFNKTPFDHYLRAFTMADLQRQSENDSYCIGDTPRAITFCKFWREMQIMYQPMGGRHFSILLENDLSHNDYNTVQMLDEHWVREFSQLYLQGFFNDTLLIVMGDHGRRFGPVRQTQSGKLEEKLPFLSFIFPPWFKYRLPKSHANFLKNQKRLVTPFDLHETFLHLLKLKFDEDGGLGNVKNRGISLFHEIPPERTCAHAKIKAHFCSCLDWSDVKEPEKDTIILKAAQEVIDYFNREIQDVPGRCANLSLAKLVWARVLKPRDQLMAFKHSLDMDGFDQALTDKKKLEANIYQFRFITKPGGADFEASASYFFKAKKFLMSSGDINRLNRYHEQALCVLKTHGHLRSFCYCM